LRTNVGNISTSPQSKPDAHLATVADQTDHRRRDAFAAVNLHLRLVRAAPLGVELESYLHRFADVQYTLARERRERVGH
jgi:hypothetical protein